MRPQEGTCLTIFPPPLFTGWRLFGQLPERLRARVGDTVCRVRGGGRGVLVLRRGELFVRHRANVGQETVAVLADLLEVHQSDVFVCEFYWVKINAIRSLKNDFLSVHSGVFAVRLRSHAGGRVRVP